MIGGPGGFLFGDEEKREALEVLESGYLFRYGGEDNPRFLAKTWNLEQAMAEYLGQPHALAVNSGTSALWAALLAMGIGPGDEVIVPGYTFIASMGAIVYARAVPVLAEIDETLTLDPADVEARITPRTRAIMLVHMLGSAGRVQQIRDLAQRRGLMLIEDCAQALGTFYRGRHVGSFGCCGT